MLFLIKENRHGKAFFCCIIIILYGLDKIYFIKALYNFRC